MALTKKHFKLFAEMIKEEFVTLNSPIEEGTNIYPSRTAEDEIERIARKIASICNEDNINFDFAKFYRACGILL